MIFGAMRSAFLDKGAALVEDGPSVGNLANICPGAVFNWFSLDGFVEINVERAVADAALVLLFWLILLRFVDWKMEWNFEGKWGL